MSNAAPLIAYGSSYDELPADRLLRRIIAFSAILYGGEALIRMALHVALARKWLASPPYMSWDMGGGSDVVVMAAITLTMAALLIGGVLLLKRSPASIVVVRASVAALIVLTILGQAIAMRSSPTYRSYWSTPGAAAIEFMQMSTGLWLPILLVLLTLPPLARRMV